MLLVETKLNDILKEQLGKTITFSYKGKKREGKFILYSQKNSSIVIRIQNMKGFHSYEFPYPYDYRFHDNKIILDYSIKTISNNDVEMLLDIKKFSNKYKKKNISFWDNSYEIAISANMD